MLSAVVVAGLSLALLRRLGVRALDGSAIGLAMASPIARHTIRMQPTARREAGAREVRSGGTKSSGVRKLV